MITVLYAGSLYSERACSWRWNSRGSWLWSKVGFREVWSREVWSRSWSWREMCLFPGHGEQDDSHPIRRGAELRVLLDCFLDCFLGQQRGGVPIMGQELLLVRVLDLVGDLVLLLVNGGSLMIPLLYAGALNSGSLPPAWAFGMGVYQAGRRALSWTRSIQDSQSWDGSRTWSRSWGHDKTSLNFWSRSWSGRCN